MNYKTLVLGSFIGILTSCMAVRDFHADFDYNYDAKFKKYKTYGFINTQKADSNILHQSIRSTIATRLNAQGYYQDENPDLYVSYKVYLSDFRINGFDQINFDSWLYSRNNRDDNNLDIDKEEYQLRKQNMSQGSLLISFIDRKRSISVWQGYASGLFPLGYSPGENKNLLFATQQIMDRFRVISNGIYVTN